MEHHTPPPRGQAPSGDIASKLAEVVGRDRRVLQFAFSGGALESLLHDQGCVLTVVEPSEPDAIRAEEWAEKVLDIDLADPGGAWRFPEGEWDVVLLPDVVERLKDPGSVLRKARDLLAEGGCVVISVPNVAHASVRLSLLRGQFDCGEIGVVEEGPARYFTRSSITDLVQGCGYVVDIVDSVERALSPEELRLSLDPLGLANLEQVVRAFSEWEAVAYRYVIRAFPATEDARLAKLAEEKIMAERRLRELTREVGEYRRMASEMARLREEFAEAQAEIARSAEYAKSLETQIAEKNEFIARLEEAVAESRCRLEDCEAKIGGMAAAFKEIEASRAPGKRKRF